MTLPTKGKGASRLEHFSSKASSEHKASKRKEVLGVPWGANPAHYTPTRLPGSTSHRGVSIHQTSVACNFCPICLRVRVEWVRQVKT